MAINPCLLTDPLLATDYRSHEWHKQTVSESAHFEHMLVPEGFRETFLQAIFTLETCAYVFQAYGSSKGILGKYLLAIFTLETCAFQHQTYASTKGVSVNFASGDLHTQNISMAFSSQEATHVS